MGNPGEIDISAFGAQIPAAVAPPGDQEFDGSGVGMNSNTTAWCGTSFSAPHAAGVAALMWSLDPNLTVAQVREYILCGADDRGDPDLYGAGRLNAYNSLLSVLWGSCFRPGDLDFDGDVTKADVDILTNYLNGTPTFTIQIPTCVMDLNADNSVNTKDVKVLEDYIRSGYPDLVIPVGCI